MYSTTKDTFTQHWCTKNNGSTKMTKTLYYAAEPVVGDVTL